MRGGIMKKFISFVILGIIASAISIDVILAQDASSVSNRQIDEIVVTSRKTEENIQEVPIAVYAIDEKALDDFRPTTMRDMDSLAPNLQVGMNSASGNQSAIFVRGCGYSGVEKTNNPTVGLIVDGLFHGTNTGTLLDSFDWAKVQVNSGPQGVVYGKNTSCGNIVIERNRPSDEFEFDTEVSAGNYDAYEMGLILNIPISDKVSSRFNIRKLEHQGYYTNLHTGNDSGRLDIASISARFLITPNEDTEIYFIADGFYDRGDTAPVSYSGNPYGPGCVSNFGAGLGLVPGANNGCNAALGAVTVTELSSAGIAAIGLFPFAAFNGLEPLFSQTDAYPPHVVSLDNPEQSDMDFSRLSLEVTTSTLLGELTSTSSFVQLDDNVLQDFDGLPGFGGGQGNPATLGGDLHTARNQHYTQYSQEIRLNTNINDQINLTTGLFFWKDSIFLQQHSGGVIQTSGQDTESYAVFALLQYDITDTVALSGGFRYIDEKKTFHSQYNSIVPGGDATYGSTAYEEAPVVLPRFDNGNSWDEYMGEATLDWQASEDNLLYLRYARGFRSGGYSMRYAASDTLNVSKVTEMNAKGFALAPQAHACEGAKGCGFGVFEPEVTELIELGSKNTFMDGSLQINGAIFQTTTENFQAQSILVTQGAYRQTDTFIVNYDETEISGLELSINWLPPVDGLSIRLHLGFLDSKVNEATVDSGLIGVGGAPQAGGTQLDLIAAGSTPQLARVPETSFALTVLYEHELKNGASLNTNVTYRGFDDQNLTISSFPDSEAAYELLDATIVYDAGDWSMALIGRNLTDEAYRTHSLTSVRFQGWGDPATWMLEVRNSW
jgi:iron complex outermembrane receptor protein